MENETRKPASGWGTASVADATGQQHAAWRGRLGRARRGLALAVLGSAMAVGFGGCAQLMQPSSASTGASTADKPSGPRSLMTFTIPPDALGAHDQQLSGVLSKAGALAAAQKQPTIILVVALGQDFRYINQAIWNGVPARGAGNVRIENQTAGANQTYSVTIKVVDVGGGV